MKHDLDNISVAFRIRGSRKKLEQSLRDLSRDPDLQLRPMPFPGGWPVLFEKVISRDLLHRWAKLGRRVPHLEGIRGGEVVPHFHLNGDIVYLKKEQFQEMVGEVAKEIAVNFARNVDFSTTVDFIERLAIDTVPMPD